jgi:hypothetical protein
MTNDHFVYWIDAGQQIYYISIPINLKKSKLYKIFNWKYKQVLISMEQGWSRLSFGEYITTTIVPITS